MIKFRIRWDGPKNLGMQMASSCAYLESEVLPRIGDYVKFNEEMMDPDERGPEKSGTVVSVLHYFHDGKPSYHVVIQ